jgi:hypothetical protein
VIGATVTQQLVQRVDGEHREVASDRFSRSGCPLRAALRIWVDLQGHPGPEDRVAQGCAVVEATVDPKNERLSLRKMRHQASYRAPDASDVGTSPPPRCRTHLLPVGTASAPPVRGGIDVVDVPGRSPDGRSHPQSVVLSTDEDLEVVVDDGFGQGGELTVTPCVEEDRVPAEAIGLAGDGGLGTVERTRELAMTGARGEPRGDGDEQLGSLEVVGGRKRLAGAAAVAVEADEARNTTRGAQRAIGTVAVEAPSAGPMGGAIRPRTEGRIEPRRTHVLDGHSGPAHERVEEQDRGRTEPPHRAGFVVRRSSGVSADGHPGPSVSHQACGHRGCAAGWPPRWPTPRPKSGRR